MPNDANIHLDDIEMLHVEGVANDGDDEEFFWYLKELRDGGIEGQYGKDPNAQDGGG